MKRYAILAGGGVKGVALAGCLAAAQEKGIEFVGYGGTSAGSIVALLGAVGYTGNQIRELMVNRNFTTFLDDGGTELNRIKGLGETIFRGLSPWNALKIGTGLVWERKLLKKLYQKSGLYRADNLESFLKDAVRANYPDLADGFNFKDLLDAGGRPLKIVAADVVARKSVVFSDDPSGSGKEFNWQVIGAVRASTSYPYVFAPVQMHTNYLADGGISSNLPVFLFEQERKTNNLPIMAFDLVIPPAKGSKADEYKLFRFSEDLLMTAMESSDKLLQDLITGLHYIPVEVPRGIDTLKFSLTKAEQDSLFDAGYKAAKRYLETKVKHWFKPSLDRIEELQAHQRVRRDTVKGLLSVIATEFQTLTSATKVRCSIMLPTGGDTQIIVYQYGMDGHPDFGLEIDLAAGWSGDARLNRRPVVADLEQDAATVQKRWRLSASEHARIPTDRKAALCLPLFDVSTAVDGKIDADKDGLLGTLCIDTATSLGETGWGSVSATVGRDYELSKVVRDHCLLWGEVLSRLLS